MRKRKIAAATGAAGVALVAAAAMGTAGNAAPAAPTADKLKIVFVAALINDSYFVTIKCGALAAGKSLGVDVKWEGPTSNSVSAELSAFQAAAATNPDGMVLAPFSNTGFGGVIRPLMKKGVPVTLSGQAVEPPDGLTTYISNFLKGGNSLATEVGKLTGGTGTMAIVADSTGNKTDSDRYTGLVPILKKKYPKLKIVGPQYAQLASLKVRDRIRTLLLFRLDALAGQEEALRRALAIQAMPQNLPRTARFGWRSADLMWRLAGDTATDYNHYTKRLLLAGIYTATLLAFVDDESEGKAETRAFLDRRIEGVMKFEKAKAKWLGKREGFDPMRFLGRLRYPAR